LIFYYFIFLGVAFLLFGFCRSLFFYYLVFVGVAFLIIYTMKIKLILDDGKPKTAAGY